MTQLECCYSHPESQDDVKVLLPARFEVCDDCEGHGTVLNESMRSHCYTTDEFNEVFDDDDREHYFRHGGKYDVVCPTCAGKRVVPALDEANLTVAQRAAYEQVQETERRRARDRADDERTMRAESGQP
jgi:hypothetical protein